MQSNMDAHTVTPQKFNYLFCKETCVSAVAISKRSYKSLKEYYSILWDPQNQFYIKQIESVQNKTAEFVSND